MHVHTHARTRTHTHQKSGAESPPEMPKALAEQRHKERQFLEQLLDTSKLENYTVPVPIKADLRKYQQVRTRVDPSPQERMAYVVAHARSHHTFVSELKRIAVIVLLS